MCRLAAGEGEGADALDPRLGVARAEEERNEASILRHVGSRRAHVEVAVDEDHARSVVDDDLARLDAFFALGPRVRLRDRELLAEQAAGCVDLFEPDLRRERRGSGVGCLPATGRDGEAHHDLVVVRLHRASPAGDKCAGHDGAHHSFQHRPSPSGSHIDSIPAGSALRGAGRNPGCWCLRVTVAGRVYQQRAIAIPEHEARAMRGETPCVTGRGFLPCPAPPTTHREWPRTPA